MKKIHVVLVEGSPLPASSLIGSTAIAEEAAQDMNLKFINLDAFFHALARRLRESHGYDLLNQDLTIPRFGEIVEETGHNLVNRYPLDSTFYSEQASEHWKIMAAAMRLRATPLKTGEGEGFASLTRKILYPQLRRWSFLSYENRDGLIIHGFGVNTELSDLGTAFFKIRREPETVRDVWTHHSGGNKELGEMIAINLEETARQVEFISPPAQTRTIINLPRMDGKRWTAQDMCRLAGLQHAQAGTHLNAGNLLQLLAAPQQRQ